MKISTVLIGLMIFTAVFAGFYSFASDLADESPAEINQTYLSSFDHSRNISIEISEKYARIQNFSVNKGLVVQIITLVPEALGLVIDMVLFPFNIANDMVTTLRELFGFPDWTQDFLLASIGAILIFALIGAILRWKA